MRSTRFAHTVSRRAIAVLPALVLLGLPAAAPAQDLPFINGVDSWVQPYNLQNRPGNDRPSAPREAPASRKLSPAQIAELQAALRPGYERVHRAEGEAAANEWIKVEMGNLLRQKGWLPD